MTGALPVNIFWKAVSTLVESRADVSINDKLFFSEKEEIGMLYATFLEHNLTGWVAYSLTLN